MNEKDFIDRLRVIIGDEEEPYVFETRYIKGLIYESVGIYSKYNPKRSIGVIHLSPDIETYPLNDDYQMWIKGLEGYVVFDKYVVIDKNKSNCALNYEYYADRKINEIPLTDINLLFEYCKGCIIERSLIKNNINGYNIENNIAALKLGKGLDISFNTNEALINELQKIAKKSKEYFFNGIKTFLSGSWC